MAMGPVLGGVAVHQLGIAHSYFVVGGAIASLALLNHVFLAETKPAPQPQQQSTLPGAHVEAHVTNVVAPTRLQILTAAFDLRSSLRTWRDLLRSAPLRDLVAMNTVFQLHVLIVWFLRFTRLLLPSGLLGIAVGLANGASAAVHGRSRAAAGPDANRRGLCRHVGGVGGVRAAGRIHLRHLRQGTGHSAR